MKIYKIDNSKSKISWSGKVGKFEVGGEIDTNDGNFITELGELVEGNINIDLKSLKILSSSFGEKEMKKLRDHFESSSIFDREETPATYKIKKIIPDEKEKTIKGILSIGDLAFGMDMHATIEQSDDVLHAKGNIKASKSNFQFLEELEKLYANLSEDEKEISSFEIYCDITATTK